MCNKGSVNCCRTVQSFYIANARKNAVCILSIDFYCEFTHKICLTIDCTWSLLRLLGHIHECTAKRPYNKRHFSYNMLKLWIITGCKRPRCIVVWFQAVKWCKRFILKSADITYYQHTKAVSLSPRYETTGLQY